MFVEHIQQKFEQIGARVAIQPPVRRRSASLTPFRIDIGRDRQGEFFELFARDELDLSVLDVQPQDRHLLLMLREENDRPGLPDLKSKFLCGHDERHWFVAAVPETVPVSSVITAKEALKPAAVRALQRGQKGRFKKRQKRRTEHFIRQGEWFFLPAPDLVVPKRLILTNEPLRRGGGKPHRCAELYRSNGETVYVNRKHPNGLLEAEYKSLLRNNPQAKSWGWQVMKRGMNVFVRGSVSHADHATLHLNGWHRVAVNTENEARGTTQVAFLD